MYIKEINATGFKSFADKVHLELNKNFTGIVGPNGSGKSNIVDAIKWVLGEQSVKTLRGSSGMKDVIFNGSKSRKQSSSASVTITFDNTDRHLPTDYNEVSIKRVVYLSGENEYFLNKSKCRLKDITDLFIDSFSSKESINIISQGKVEEILSNKPEDRRTILEEAAGVLKYKRRKEESLRKLSKTHENIDRVNLIVNELSVNIEPLKKQAKDAKEYIEKKDKLKNIEVTLAVLDIENNNNIFKQKEESIKAINEKILSTSTNNTKEETKLEELKRDEINIEEQITQFNNKLSLSNHSLISLAEKKELSKERSKYNSEDIKVKNNLIETKEKILKLESVIKLEEKEIKDKEKEKKQIENELKSNNEKYYNVEKKLKTIEEDINNINKKILEFKNKIELTQNNINSSLRVPYSVKSILDNPRLSGIRNTIGNIINTEEKYSLVLETALSSAINFVITDDEECAKEGVKYLKNNKLGRVTFFPLSVIKSRYVDSNTIEEIKNENGFIDIASNLVTYDKEYKNIVTNQLGNIIVTDNINSAIKIGRKIQNRYRIVTLEGDIIHVGGSLTGGSNKNTSVIGDKFELQRINNLLKSYEMEKESKNLTLEQLTNNLNTLKDSIYKQTLLNVNIKEVLNTKNTTLNDYKNNLYKLNDEISMLNSNDLEKEFDKLMKDYYKEEENNKLISKELNNLKNKKEDLLQKVQSIENTIKKENTLYNDLNNKLKEEEIEKIKVETIIDNLLNILNENYSLTFESAKEHIVSLNEEEARKELVELKRKVKNFKNINLGSIEEYERVNKRYEFLNSQKEDLLSSEQNLLSIINEMDNTMEEKFINTFNKINKEFNKVFNNLFSGGEAHLELTDPDNFLETGIDIKATPPGKRLTNISLLSGGEKTLTAISLLFAIMNLNNVPFAILDEVEAALDESNAVRFGEYLDNYKGKTQLLIITHKKKTMEYVDLLYGITMQESGVSKVVSVKLEDVK